MAKLPYIGGFNELADTQSANDHTVNLMPEKSDGKVTWRLAPTPGSREFCDLGVGPVRGAKMCKGRAFVVAGNGFYEIFRDKTFIRRGVIDTTQGRVSIDHNGFQVIFTDGLKAYVFVVATNDFGFVDDPDWYPSSSMAVVDGYAVFIRDDTQQFFHSDLYDAFTYLGLDFESAETNPDNSVAVVNDASGLIVLGEQSLELFWDAGEGNQVFQRRQGSKISYGCIGPNTAVETDNGLIWVGRDPDGDGGVFRLGGANPTKISNGAIDEVMQRHNESLPLATAWSYRQGSHTFYVLNIPDVDTTFLYDLSTGFWHERRSFYSNGKWGKWIADCHIPAFGKNLVGTVDGKLMELDPTYYYDNGQIIRRERVLKPIFDDSSFDLARYYSLTIDCPVGVGLESGPYSDPKIILEISDDGGQHYGVVREAPIGRSGQTKTKVQFRRLGISRNRVFKVIYTYPTPFAISGVYVDAAK